MIKRILPAVILLLLCLTAGCASDTDAALPAPGELYASISELPDFPEMLELTDEEILYMIGIEPHQYTEAAAYTALSGTSPEEILIFLAADEENADLIEQALRDRLQYKRDSARLYLSENQPLLDAGTVRRDNLTVSLLVIRNADEVLKLYP